MPCTHEQNVLIEQMFVTLFGRVQMMLNGCSFDEVWHDGLLAEVCSNFVGKNMVILTYRVSPFCHIFRKYVKSISSSPHKFCKTCMETTLEKIKVKMKIVESKIYWLDMESDML